MSETLSQLIRSTKEYSDVCDTCRDEILLYPTISGRTNYTQKEVEEITLKRIIDKLKRAKQEYEELRQEHNSCCEEFKQEINLRIDAYNKLSRDFWSGKYCNAKYCKQLQAKEQECEKLKATLNKIEKLLRAASDPEITTAEESFDNIYECINLAKNSSDINDSFSNDKKAKYEQALDEIEKYQKRNCETCIFANTQKCNINCQVFVILDIISKAKEK